MMLDRLPEPDAALLAHPPAQVVTFSLLVEAERPLRPTDGVSWQRELDRRGFSPSVLRKVVQQTLSVQAGAPLLVASGEKSDAWQVQPRSLEKAATVTATGCTLERTRYPGFEAFSAEVRAVCEAFAAIFQPSVRSRVGLKYSNALSEPDAISPQYWKGKVSDAFLSIVGDERFSEVARTFGIVELQQDSNGLQVRSAVQPDAVYAGSFAFVFDIETSDAALTAFDIGDTMEALAALNRSARQIFQAVLTPEYYALLKEQRTNVAAG